MNLELVDIHKSFGPVRANDGISLRVEPGTIHGLLGENGAGKTTLMKCLSGFLSPDGGLIRVNGQPVRFDSPAGAIGQGIGMLHQDPLDFPQMQVLDNFLLGSSGRMIPDRRSARAMLQSLCTRFQFELDPETDAGSLTIGERQQLEILRLLSLGVEVIILDEPTTGISAPQKAQLFDTLRRLAHEEGHSVIFVSHKLEDVEQLCDRITVLREGRVTGEAEMPCPLAHIVQLMFGRMLPSTERSSVAFGSAALQLEGVSVPAPRLALENVSLQAQAGEVIGLAGLEGGGQRRLLRACAGLQRVSSGRVLLGGQDLTGADYGRFLQAGVAYMPAGRLDEGLVSGLTLTEHVVLCERRGPFIVDWTAARSRAQTCIHRFNIVGHPESQVETLSGGNQQRVLLALLPPCLRLLLLEHPTRGLDISSARWIWQQLLARREEGTAIVFISADLEELLERSDRILVFFGGRITKTLEARDATAEQLGFSIAGRRMAYEVLNAATDYEE